MIAGPIRRAAGLLILAGAVGATAAGSAMRRSALREEWVVPFARGDRPGDGAEGVEARAASFLRAYPKARVRLTGHTEAGGDAAADVALSERRAVVVRDALESLGVARDRMAAVGAGAEDAPRREADETDAGYARRQARVSVRVTED